MAVSSEIGEVQNSQTRSSRWSPVNTLWAFVPPEDFPQNNFCHWASFDDPPFLFLGTWWRTSNHITFHLLLFFQPHPASVSLWLMASSVAFSVPPLSCAWHLAFWWLSSDALLTGKIIFSHTLLTLFPENQLWNLLSIIAYSCGGVTSQPKDMCLPKDGLSQPGRLYMHLATSEDTCDSAWNIPVGIQ